MCESCNKIVKLCNNLRLKVSQLCTIKIYLKNKQNEKSNLRYFFFFNFKHGVYILRTRKKTGGFESTCQ